MREMIAARRSYVGIGAVCVLAAAWPAAVTAQEAVTRAVVDQEPAADSVDTGPVTPQEADAIRDTVARPPAGPSTDWVDVVEFPLRIIGWPLNMLLVRVPAYAAARLTAPRPPDFLVRSYREAVDWGLYPAIRTTIGPRSAAAIELQLSRFRPVYVHAAVSRRLSQRYRAGLLGGDVRRWWATELKWQRDSELPWYGIGADTRKTDRAFYRRDWFTTSLRGGIAILSDLAANVGVAYENNVVGDPVLSDNSLFDAFDTEGLFGANVRTEYVRLELNATLDLTEWRDFQQHGMTAGLAGFLYEGVNGTDSGFHAFTGFLQGYVPVNRRQLLALRAVAHTRRDDQGDGVPFYHLSSLGGSRTSLGYPSNRFRDHDLLALMSEWRYEVWREINGFSRAEMFLFFNYGAVAEQIEDVFDSSDAWNASYGLGMRITGPTALIGLGYLGFNPRGEGITAGIRGSWPF
jgi:hypothetical protein